MLTRLSHDKRIRLMEVQRKCQIINDRIAEINRKKTYDEVNITTCHNNDKKGKDLKYLPVKEQIRAVSKVLDSSMKRSKEEKDREWSLNKVQY